MTHRQPSMALFILLILFAGSAIAFAQSKRTSSISMNRIEGRITDEANNGVNNAYVELYDSSGAFLDRQQTNGQGRFTFKGMGSGRYTISVKPLGGNLAEDSKEVEIVNLVAQIDTEIVDFRLHVDKRFRNDDIGVVGTIFAQEVPAEAERSYKAGLELVHSDPEKAVVDFENAIKLFPTYFNALAALGKIYVVRAKYANGYPYLLRAIDVNTRCGDCYYSLALAFYKLDQISAAVKAVDAAVLLQPKLPAAYLLQGIIYRLNNDLPGAEKALLMAKSLFKESNPEVHRQLALVYNRLNRNQQAADELELYLKTKPDITKEERQSTLDLIAKLRTSK